MKRGGAVKEVVTFPQMCISNNDIGCWSIIESYSKAIKLFIQIYSNAEIMSQAALFLQTPSARAEAAKIYLPDHCSQTGKTQQHGFCDETLESQTLGQKPNGSFHARILECNMVSKHIKT